MTFLESVSKQYAIRLVTQPRVYLAGVTDMGLGNMEDFLQDEEDLERIHPRDNKLWDHGDDWASTSDGEALVEFGGRLCYNSFGDKQGSIGNREYVQNIRMRRHGSVLEHANFSLLIADVSRGLTHELVRHRHFSYSQQSSRYCDMERAVVIPPQARDNEALMLAWVEAVSEELRMQDLATKAYEAEHGSGTKADRMAAREFARSLMPHASVTRILVTGNARAWRNFMALRGSMAAEPEMRQLAVEVCTRMNEYAPHLFSDMYVQSKVYGEESVEPGLGAF